MDPISIVGLVDASVDLALKCASAVRKMKDIASKYKHSELTLRSIAHNLDTMQFAWDRIGAWIQSHDENTDDDGFVLRMARFLETGTLVMDALEKELLPFSDETLGFAERAKLVWNENIFLDHQTRVRDQAMSKERGKLIRESDKQFKKSDESAYSIVPSRMSILTRQTDDQESIRSEEEIVYRRLSFEDDLFTARVYKRNYRNPMLLRLLKTESWKDSEDIILPARIGHAHIRGSREDKPGSVTNHSQEPIHSRSLRGAHLPSTAQKTHQQRKDLNALEITSEPPSNPTNESKTSFQDTEDDETLDPRSARLAERPMRQRSASSNEESSRIFMNACEQGDLTTVQQFLEIGHDVHSQQAYPDSPGFGAIHAAARYGHIAIVQILLQYGTSIADRTTSNGSQPLHLAAQSGDAGMIQFLLRAGAEIGAKNQLGEQPIHLAARSGSIETLRILIGEGAALDCADDAGRQPLHWAAIFDRPDVIEYLVKADAGINARDGIADTALHKVALSHPSRLQDSQLLSAQTLLDNNANCDALDILGHTPLYLAINGHQHAISTLLIESGARYLILHREETLRLHVHGSMLDMLYRFSAPNFLDSTIAENMYEEALVQRILNALDNLIASGIPVRMVRYDHQAEDDNEISQFLRMSNRIKLLLDRDPRTRLSKRYESPVSSDWQKTLISPYKYMSFVSSAIKPSPKCAV